ncbi:Glutamate-gated chloride channel [Folsomia candida]|uniref:Glutamate-gated chloride channel n=1 Tax=Folsomia candida TaxID=158441 RepID=A0A226DSJ8_FOLCA|nr:Glutamate-gated chloride channel [Folsomia candida]
MFIYSDAHRYITLPATTLGKTLWKPDLFFSNELEYSIHADGFTTDDIIFKWKAVDPVQLASDLHLPSFALQQFTTDYCDSRTNTGTYSCLRVDLLFARELNRYLSKLFIPMITSILLIWVSTWITPSNSGLIVARALLLGGASFYCKWSILTGPARPSAIISYTTALDMWDTFCTGFILLGILEFVLISRDCGKGCDDLNGSQDRHVCSRRIDFVTRIIYPIGFLACVCIYFGAYLAKAKEQDGDETE